MYILIGLNVCACVRACVCVCVCPLSAPTLFHSPFVCVVELGHITRLVLAHNKLSELPDTIVELRSLEFLSLFGNALEVCVCVCVRACVRACVCVCVRVLGENLHCIPPLLPS